MNSNDATLAPAFETLLFDLGRLSAAWRSDEPNQVRLSQMYSLLTIKDFLFKTAPDFAAGGGADPIEGILFDLIDSYNRVLRNEAKLESTGNAENMRGKPPLGTAEMVLRVKAITCVERLIHSGCKPAAARKSVAQTLTSGGRKSSAKEINDWKRTWIARQPVRDTWRAPTEWSN